MMRRTLPILCVFLFVLGVGGPSQAGEIATFDQARDRFLAQVTDGRTDVLEAYGDASLREGPVALRALGAEVGLGSGPGWLFAAKIQAALADLYVAAFVGQDAIVQTRMVKILPEGLVVLAQQKTNETPAPVASRDEAYARLLAGLLGHSAKGRRIYSAAQKVETPSIAIASWKGEITVPGGPGWLFFVDDNPRANWTHPCRYVLVSEEGTLHVVKATTPPNDMGGFTELSSWPAPDAASKNALMPTNAATGNAALTARTATPAANRHAVIISGGANASSNYPRYWNDCAYFYRTLKAYGFLSENITVLFADGTDPAVDNSAGESSNLDLDGDGNPDINYSATKANVTLAFNALAAKLGSDDILYIFTTDHGGNQDGNDAPYALPNVVLYLWGESITGDELAAEVNKVTAKAVAGIFEQCFSGGLTEKLKAENRVLMSASRWWELSYAMGPNYQYDEFSYYATKALAEPTSGDTNGDGIVTLEEAYLYALAKDANQSEALDGQGDNTGEHPAYSSSPWDLGRKLSLSGSEPSARPPQKAGYIQTQSADASPPLGTAQGWQADDGLWSCALPFSFPFAGNRYASVSVSSNGILYFNSSDLGSSNTVDLLKTGRAIAPLWDDLTTVPAGCDIHVYASALYADIAWVAKTVIDARPVNMTVRLFPNGAFTFFYGDGNEHTSRVAQRDKTIGVSTITSALFGLRNGASDLGAAPALAFSRTANAVAPENFLLLLQ